MFLIIIFSYDHIFKELQLTRTASYSLDSFKSTLSAIAPVFYLLYFINLDFRFLDVLFEKAFFTFLNIDFIFSH